MKLTSKERENAARGELKTTLISLRVQCKRAGELAEALQSRIESIETTTKLIKKGQENE